MPKFTIVYFLYYYYKDRDNLVSEFGRQENFIDILSANGKNHFLGKMIDGSGNEVGHVCIMY